VLIRKLRLQRGWTQDQLAEMAGLSVRTIQRLERGDAPSLESAKALASVFEVDLATFHPEQPDMTQTQAPTGPQTPPPGTATTAQITPEETASLVYAKNVKEFYQGIIVYVVLAVVFFAKFGFHEPVVWWVFGGAGAGIALQGLLAFEKIRLPSVDWEKRIAEKKLGRKL
jgi:transcriptional regulator with XRE-family HTH domain